MIMVSAVGNFGTHHTALTRSLARCVPRNRHSQYLSLLCHHETGRKNAVSSVLPPPAESAAAMLHSHTEINATM